MFNRRGAALLGASIVVCAWGATACAQTVISTTTIYNAQNVPLTGTLDINGVGTPTLFLQNGTTLTSGLTTLTVGNLQTGALDISGGSILSNSGPSYVGGGTSSTGGVSVTGIGSQWIAGGQAFIGNQGVGSLSIGGGGTVISGSAVLGSQSTGLGQAVVSGTGSRWTSTGDLYLGNSGRGTLTLTNGGVSSASVLYLGAATTGSGTLVVGGGSVWTSTNTTWLGQNGRGALNVEAQGVANVATMYVGLNGSATGTANVAAGGTLRGNLIDIGNRGTGSGQVAGANSLWSSTLFLGYYGNGSFTVTDGGRFETFHSVATSAPLPGGGTTPVEGSLLAGLAQGGQGQLVVSGSGSRFNASGELLLGISGTGTLAVRNGGFASGSAAFLGREATGTGIVTIADTGSRLTLTGDLYLGGNTSYSGGVASMSVGNGGTVTVGNTLKLWNQGTLTITGGSVTARNFDRTVGTFNLLNGTVTVSGGVYTHTSGMGGAGNIFTINGATLGDNPTFTLRNGAIAAGVEATVVGSSGSGTLVVSNGGNLTNSGPGTVISTSGTQIRSGYGYLGLEAGSVGSATISTTGRWLLSGELRVGDAGQGAITITGGGIVESDQGYLGYSAGGFGTALISGTGSRWTVTNNLSVGSFGGGSLTVTGGGTVQSFGMTVGTFTNQTGTGLVSGAGSQITLTNLIVGHQGVGILTITGGARVSATTASVAGESTATGTVLVSGANTQWNITNTLNVGQNGLGTVTITGGARLTSGEGYLGREVTGTGSILISGAGSEWSQNGILYAGYFGNGTLTIADGGRLTNSATHLGANIGATGTAHVSGANTQWMGSDLHVGGSGQGSLTITDGAFVINPNGYVGSSSTGVGTVLISGTNSRWTQTGQLSVGEGGQGTLTLTGGGQMASDYAKLGSQTTGTGTILVSGTNSQWTVAQVLTVGDQGRGSLTLADGGRLITGTAFLTPNVGASGTVLVTGVNSRWTVTNRLELGVANVASGDTASLTLADGGALDVGATLKLWNQGTLTITGGSVTAQSFDRSLGTVNLLNGSLTVSGGVYTHTGGTSGAGNILTINGATAADNPTFAMTGGATDVGVEATVIGSTNQGTLLINGGSVLSLSGSATQIGSITGTPVLRGSSYLGFTPTGFGTVVVSGTGSTWSQPVFLVIGGYGSGMLTVTDGGRVTSGFGSVGGGSASNSSAVVSGLNSLWTMTQGLIVGESGTGSLQIADGGRVISGFGYLGSDTGGKGTATISGLNSAWTMSTTLFVGRYGNGDLDVDNGGSLTTNVASVGSDTTGVGTVRLTGQNSSWTSIDAVYVGDRGLGMLNLNDGAHADVYRGFLGFNATGTGTTTISGLNSRLTVTNELSVGNSGRGELNLTNAGTVISRTGYLGRFAGSIGTGSISGTGSNWSVTNNLYVGGDVTGSGGAGTLIVGSGGTLNVGANTTLWSTGTLTIGTGGTFGTGSLVGNVRNDGLLIIGGTNGSSTYAQVISGNGIVEKTGSGTVIFTGANTYQAGTLISEGTLQIGDNSAGASIAGAVLNRGTLQFAGTDTQTMNDSISGSGGLVKLSTGTLVLSFVNTYTGGTTISGGTLRLQGGNNRLATTGNMLLNGGSLDVTGTQTVGTATLNSSASSITGTGTFNATSFDFRSGTVSARLGIGTLQKSTTSTVTISGANNYAGGTTILAGTLVAANNGALGIGSLVIGDTSGSTSATLSLNSGITLDRNITIRAGSGGSANLVAGNATGTATFSGDILLNKNVTLHAFGSGVLEFRDGTISGTGGIVKMSSGTVLLSGQGDYTGATTINAGVLKLGNNDALGTGTLTQQTSFGLRFAAGVDAPVLGGLAGRDTLDLTDDANGEVNLIVGGNNASTTFTGGVQGLGSLTKVGTGTLTLTGNLTVNATILGGTLHLGGTTTAGFHFGTVLNNATLSLSGTASSQQFVSISGTGGVQYSGNRVLNGVQSYTGVTTIASGTLQLGFGSDIGNFASSVANNGVLIFSNTNLATASGSISGAGSVSKQASGTLVFTGTNSYTGTTTVMQGGLRAVDGVGLSTASNLLLRDGGFLESSGLITRTLGTGAGQLRFSGSGGFAAFGGNLDLNFGGAGSTIVWGQASFLSTTEGLFLGSTTADGRTRLLNPIDLAGGTRGVGVVDNLASTNDYAELAGKLSNGGLAKGGDGLLVLTGNNDYAGGTTISFGTLQIGAGGTSGSAGTGAITIGGLSRTLIVDRSDAITFTQTISGSGNFVQQGTGTTVLLDAQYTGTTRVTAGTLELNRAGLDIIYNDSHLVLNVSTTQSQYIFGSGDVVKQGTGTLVLGGFGYSGTTTISAGTLQLNLGNDEVTSPGSIVNNARLQVGEIFRSFELTRDISGTGDVQIEGTYSHLSGNNTYSGTTTLIGGMSGNLSAASNLAFAGLSSIVPGGTLEMTGSFTRALGAGSGEVRWVEGFGGFRPVDGDITVNIGGDLRQLTVGDPFFVDSTKTLLLHNGTTISSDVAKYGNHKTLWLNPIDVNGSVLRVAVLGPAPTNYEAFGEMAGVISNGSLFKSGGGLLILSAANTYAGTTTVGGTLRAEDGVGLPTASALVLAGNLQTHGTINRSLGTGAGQISWIDTGGFMAFGGDLTVNLGGNGAEVTWGAGGFVPTAKTLRLGGFTSDGRTIFENDLDLAGGTRDISVAGANTQAPFTRVVGELSGVIRNGGLRATGAGTLILSGANTYSGTTSIFDGVLRAVDGVGLPTASNLSIGSGSAFESSGSFTRALGTGAGQVQFNTSGTGNGRNGFAAFGGDLTVNLFGDGRDVGLNQFGQGLSFGSFYADARTVLTNGVDLNGNNFRHFYTYDNVNSTADYGEIAGVVRNGGVLKQGTGLLVLSGDNTYAAGTTIAEGTLRAGHDHALGTGSVIIQNGARLDVAGGITIDNTLSIQAGGSVGGSGTINSHVVVGNGGIVSPGNSPGTQTVAMETWATGGNYLWEINDVDAGMGVDPGWDWINVTNQLNITATSGGQFNILVTSLALSNAAGPVHDFNPFSNYSWTLASAGGGVTGFNSSAFNINTSGFQNSFSGSFGIALVGNDLNLTYTAIPEPSSFLLAAAAAGGMAWRRRRRKTRAENQPAVVAAEAG